MRDLTSDLRPLTSVDRKDKTDLSRGTVLTPFGRSRSWAKSKDTLNTLKKQALISNQFTKNRKGGDKPRSYFSCFWLVTFDRADT